MAGDGNSEPMMDGGRQVAGSGLISSHCWRRERRKLRGNVWLLVVLTVGSPHLKQLEEIIIILYNGSIHNTITHLKEVFTIL